MGKGKAARNERVRVILVGRRAAAHGLWCAEVGELRHYPTIITQRYLYALLLVTWFVFCGRLDLNSLLLFLLIPLVF